MGVIAPQEETSTSLKMQEESHFMRDSKQKYGISR
jgi:hypothetical protein